MVKARIAVVGSYAVGLSMRTIRAPGPGETVEGNEFAEFHGGKGSNQAVGCARLGAETTFLACIGNDSAGDKAVSLYETEGVGTNSVIRHPTLPTAVGFIIVDEAGENQIAVDFGANRALHPTDVEAHREIIQASDGVLVQMEIPPETAMAAMRVGRECGVITVLNPAPYQPTESGWENVDVITPNQSEARLILGLAPDSDAQPRDLADGIREKGVGAVVMTLGAEGAFIASDSFTGAVPGQPVDVVDTTGAGDAFAAAITTALAEGAELRDAVSFATVAGSLAVTKYGVISALPYRADIDRRLDR